MRNLARLIASLALVASPALAQQVPNQNNSFGLIGRDTGTGLPCYVGGASTCGIPASGSVNDARASKTTYSAFATAYVPYATAQDMFGICGSATTTVRVTQFLIRMAATAATANVVVNDIVRSTADTGGTPTTLTAFPFDSANAAATATVKTFAAAPTPGSTLATIAAVTGPVSPITSTAAAPTTFSLFTSGAAAVNMGSAVTYQQSITLRGTAQCLYANFGGGAVPAGTTTSIYVEWTEE